MTTLSKRKLQSIIKQTLKLASDSATTKSLKIPYTGVRAGGHYTIKVVDKKSITKQSKNIYNILKSTMSV
jgi:stress-induced morphogen